MRNIFRVFSVIALIMAIGFSIAACGGDDNDTGSGSGSIPSALVGKWYTKADDLAFEITSAGKLIIPNSETLDISVEGKTVTLKKSGTEFGTFDYAISNGEMTLTNGTMAGIPIAAFSPVVKGSGNGNGNGNGNGGLSELVGIWKKNGVTAFEVTSAGKFIMNDTTYDISVSGSTATLKFGGQKVGTFDYAISNNQMVLFNGTGIGTTVVAFSPLVKTGGGGIIDKPITGTGITVTFDADNGTPVTHTPIEAGSRVTRPPDPSRAGYTFIAWINTNDGQVWNFNTAVTRSITLRATWLDTQVKQNAVTELTDYVGGLPQGNYDQTNWNIIQNLKTQGISAINAATTTDAVYTALASYKTQIGNVKMTIVQNIEFTPIAEIDKNGWPEGDDTKGLQAALGQLANQSQALQSQCPAEREMGSFAYLLYAVQSYIGTSCKIGTNVNVIKNQVSSCTGDLISTMQNELASNAGQDAADLFVSQANAFRQAHFLNQRQYYGYNGYPNDKDAQEAALLAQVNGMGINATTIPEAITALKAALKSAALPPEVKQYMDGIIQQWEDFAQFDGWTTDLEQTNLALSMYNLGPRQ